MNARFAVAMSARPARAIATPADPSPTDRRDTPPTLSHIEEHR